MVSQRRPIRIAAVAIAGLLGGAFAVATPAVAAPVDTVHDFEVDAGAFFAYGDGVTSAVVDGEFCADVPAHTGDTYDIAMPHNAIALTDGAEYDIALTARSTADVSIRAQVGVNAPPYPSVDARTLEVTEQETAFTYSFTSNTDAAATESGGQFSLQLGDQGEQYTFCIDDFSLTAAGSGDALIPNGDFASGALDPWFAAAAFGEPDLSTGALCVAVPAGGSVYDGVGFNGLAVKAGTTYTLTYTASASSPRTIRTIIGENGGSYRTVLEQAPPVTDVRTVFTHTFTSPLEFPATTTVGGPYEGQLAFQVGGRSGAYTFCIDDVSLVESTTPPPAYQPETGPRVRVNQVGYLPEGPKRATLVTDSDVAVPWTLLSGGSTLASGVTVPAGLDASAGLEVHTIDFSDVSAAGAYTLVADGETSYEFMIDAGIYQQLRYDALNYFYLARSGIAIDAAVVGPEYAREAGHVGVAPNQGDTDVACLTDAAESDQYSYGDWTCDYTLDVTGGWYDAGDHGKYVVNGGIAAAQVMSTYERTLTGPSAAGADLGDGTLAVPVDESSNGVPDALDEARWELEFMQSMQVPSGEYVGMVHHKIHDMGWTGLPLAPADDPQQRYLHRPSTAATLNFAATAAQGARLWADHDAAFATELLAAGRVAWDAALATPDLYAPADMGNNGGGPYDDAEVGDEFYWAAAELFLTTGEQPFEDYVLASSYHTADIWTPSGFSWGETAALGRLDLATVESDIEGRSGIRESVVAGAEKYLAWQQQPFGTTYPGLDGRYEWGSNSMVLNNQVVLGTAFDLTSDQRFADAVLEAMDYLLGRNALNNSYLTGYGTVYSENQHSRWFANALNPDLPNPPAGSIAGGPNSTVSTWDPVISALYDADYMCAPQLCYVDDIQSWSTNEITVNWNSALSWVASFAADQGDGRVEVDTPVRIETDPQDVTAAVGEQVRFTASASSDPEATVQWQILDEAAWVDLDGETASELTFTAAADDDGSSYRAVFSNRVGSLATSAATLTVSAAALQPSGAGAVTPSGDRTATGRLSVTGADANPWMWVLLGGLLIGAGSSLALGRRRMAAQSVAAR